MKYRLLGATGIKVSEIGFGAWGIGGVSNGATSYGKVDDKESSLALRKAYELGVTFFDTSDLYGYGHSEELIGKTLGDVRKKIAIASKVGFLEHNGPWDFSCGHIEKAIKLSLKRLKTDYLDVYQLHSPLIELVEKDSSIVNCLRKLKAEGKIRAFGISVRNPEDALIAVGKLGFDCVQLNFNLIDQRARETKVFELCGKKNVGVIIRTPLCFGFLTGRYSSDTHFNSSDHRSVWPQEQRRLWAGAYKIFLKVLMEKNKQTAAQLALRFCLSFKEVSVVIPGMLNRKEVQENVSASDFKVLTKYQLKQIYRIYNDNTFFLGKQKNCDNMVKPR